MSTHYLEKLLWGVLATYVGACAVAWRYLPERMPLHFGFDGRVTTWVDTSAVLWFMLPALCVGLVLLIRAAGGPPDAWNLPRADVARFRTLPPDVQEQIRNSAKRASLVALVCVTAMFAGVQLSLYVTAVRQSPRTPHSTTVLLIGPAALLMIIGWRDKARLQRQIRTAAEDQQPT